MEAKNTNKSSQNIILLKNKEKHKKLERCKFFIVVQKELVTTEHFTTPRSFD